MKIGTIGTGKILDNFLSAINEIRGAKCLAIYSRKQETADALALKYNVAKTYTDIDKMYDDPDIDFIYIASPNSLHYDYSLRALQKGKNVICEKPFTSTINEIETLSKTAKKNRLMIFEAITTIHLPNYKLIKDNLHKIGEMRMVICNYSQYSSRYDALLSGETPNVFNPAFSGGALQDINIYNLHFVMNMFGEPDDIKYTANKHSNGIDTSGVLILKYSNFICQCVGAKDSSSENFAYLQGEKGFISVYGGGNGCREFSVHDGKNVTTINEQKNKNLLYYEIMDFIDIYNRKDYKSCYKLLDYSESVMNSLVMARKDAGIFSLPTMIHNYNTILILYYNYLTFNGIIFFNLPIVPQLSYSKKIICHLLNFYKI